MVSKSKGTNTERSICTINLGRRRDVPTDIDYAKSLLHEAEKQGDGNASKILNMINC